MEWMDSLNRALRYVESHLTDEGLSVEAVAKAAAYSPFYLQRVFYVLTDETLADYIRARRLSAAGQALQGGAKVLDTALRYGYESPESFAKAFRRFHGITPSAAQRTRAQLKYLSPLAIKVELTGGSIMDYAVEPMGELRIIGKVRRFALDGAFGLIPGYWDEYHQQGLDSKVCGYLGVCFDETDKDFAYMIGAFQTPEMQVPEGFEVHTLAAGTWAKFRAVGALPDSIQKLNRQIFTEWLPGNTEYELVGSVNVEMYSEGDMDAADYVSEIWLPVRRMG
jgi:AraC family transcriptional regulator